MSWITLRTAIKTKLDTLTGLGQISDYFHSNITSYPAVMFEPSDDPSGFFTNTENEHVYTYDLFVIQECESTATGRQAAIRILGNAIDTVVNAFDSYQTLGGACEYTEPMVSSWNTANTANGIVVYGRITLKCHKLKTVT